jgi:DmsE family decaheme c-type cytochrome
MKLKVAVFVACILAFAIAVKAAQPAGPLPEDQKKAAAASSAKVTPVKMKANADYVGSETCIGCHDDQQNRFKNTPMGRAFAKPHTAAEKQGCEACHGPGKAHVDAGGGKETIPIRFGKDSPNSVEEQNGACIECHKRGNRMFWKGSPHESRGMKCVDCHQVKQQVQRTVRGEAFLTAPLTDIKGMKKTQPELCLECHQMRRAQLQRSSHMPFREGKVTCTSCHNPHGTPNPAQLIQATVNENCYSCHADRRGPFLWAHPPVTENCGTCHETHGSTNPQLLKMRTPRLCQQCHGTTSSNPMGHGGSGWPGGSTQSGGVTVGLSNRVLTRGCANCHSKIHGTNAPSGKFFIR